MPGFLLMGGELSSSSSAPGCCNLPVPDSSWCYSFILAKPSWALVVSEVAGLLLLEIVMNRGLHFRVSFPPSPHGCQEKAGSSCAPC